MGGYDVPECVKAQALDKLVSQEQLSVIVSRPEFADYNNAKLLWVKAQMEDARGATQAQQVSATAAPKWDRDGDVSMGAVLQDASCRSADAQESSLLWHRPRRMCQACSWWRLGWRQRGERRDHGSGKRQR